MNETYSELDTVGLKAKAVRGGGINITAQFVGFVCHTVGVIVLARLLTPKDFGLVAMVTAFSLWIMNFGVNGFTEFIIQKQHISNKEINSIFWLHVFLSTLLAIGFIFFGLFLVQFYAEPALSRIAAAMATSFILYALFTSHFALLKREMRFSSIAITELIAVILSIVFAIAVAIGGMGYWAVVTRQLTIPAVTMIAAWILCPWRPGHPHSLSTAVPGLKYAVKVYCNFSIRYLTRSVDKVLLGKFYGSELLGNYDRAYHLSSLPASQLITPLHSVALATLSRLKDDRERFLVYYTKAVSMVAFLGIMAAIGLTLSARDLIPLLLGPEWAEAGPVVMAFGPGIAAMLVYETHSWLHLSLGTAGRWLRWNLIATALTITAFAISAPFGAVAMAIAYSATSYLLVVPGLWYAGHPIKLNIATMLRCMWPYFTAGMATSIIWLSLPVYWPLFNSLFMEISPLSRVVMTVCIAPLLYIAAVIVLQRSLDSLRELIALLKVFLSR